MSKYLSLQSAVRRSLAVAAVAGSAWAVASAQTTASVTTADTEQPLQVQPLATTPGVSTQESLFSSSSSDNADAANDAATTNLASVEKGIALPGLNAQYGGRRRYGAPRYRGGNTNADGSEKYDGYAGAGFGVPSGTNSNFLSTSWGFQVGAGRNFNRHLGVNLEFDYDHFGLTGQTITNQSIVYFGDPSNTNGLDGNSHIWNFSVQPTYQIYSGQGLGAYITGGVGFYHKVTNFTLPQLQTFYSPYSFYGAQQAYVNTNVDHYTSNAPGFDGGVGVTYKFSRFANQRLYAEVRFVHILNSSRTGVTAADSQSAINAYANAGGNDYFPQNSQTTSYIPIKIGLRF